MPGLNHAEHMVEQRGAQRRLAMVLGCEDQNDRDRLPFDRGVSVAAFELDSCHQAVFISSHLGHYPSAIPRIR